MVSLAQRKILKSDGRSQERASYPKTKKRQEATSSDKYLPLRPRDRILIKIGNRGYQESCREGIKVESRDQVH